MEDQEGIQKFFLDYVTSVFTSVYSHVQAIEEILHATVMNEVLEKEKEFWISNTRVK